jgi:hypothetical protein
VDTFMYQPPPAPGGPSRLKWGGIGAALGAGAALFLTR